MRPLTEIAVESRRAEVLAVIFLLLMGAQEQAGELAELAEPIDPWSVEAFWSSAEIEYLQSLDTVLEEMLNSASRNLDEAENNMKALKFFALYPELSTAHPRIVEARLLNEQHKNKICLLKNHVQDLRQFHEKLKQDIQFVIRNLPQALIDSKSLLTLPQTCSAQERKVKDAEDNTSSVYRAYRDLELDTASLKYRVSDLQGMVRKAERVSGDYLKRSVIACNQDANYVSDMECNVQRQEDDPKEQERLRLNGYLGKIWDKLNEADPCICQKEKHHGLMCDNKYDFLMISIPENKGITEDALYQLWRRYLGRLILVKKNDEFKLYDNWYSDAVKKRIWISIDIDRDTGLSLMSPFPKENDGLVFGIRTCGMGESFFEYSINRKNRREALQNAKGLHYLMLWIKTMLRYLDDLLTGRIEKFNKFKEVRSGCLFNNTGCLFNDREYIASIWQEKVEIPRVRNAT